MQFTAICNRTSFLLAYFRFSCSTLRVMRLTAFILLFFCLHISAKTYSQKVTITGKNLKLEKILALVEQQTGFIALYDEEVLKTANPVTVAANSQPLDLFLKDIFKGQPVGYSIKNTSIIISKNTTPVPRMLYVPPVTGIIRSVSGEPLQGVSVQVKGTSYGTMTDAAGKFSLSAKEGDVLTISYVGFLGLSVSVTGSGGVILISAERQGQKGETQSSLLNSAEGLVIHLSPSVSQLEVVTVNTGYQQISKERSAGAYSIPDLNIVRNRSSSMNILQRLDGLVPGLVINNSPGAARDGSTFQIRGLTTINADKNPLYVVDGMPMTDLSSINPQDVADISVLKDATAASIWGARASNGVIVVTTRKGVNSRKIKVDYDGFISLQGKPDIDYFPVLNSRQYIQASRETFDPAGWPYSNATAYNPAMANHVGLSPDRQILYDMSRGAISTGQGNAKLDSLAGISNLSQMEDIWYRPASLMNHTVSVSAGSEKYTFYGSVAYTNKTDNTPGNRDNTYKINTRQDISFNKHIKVFVIADLTNQLTSAHRAVSPDNRFLPYQLFRDAAGKNISMSYMGYLSDEARADASARSRINLDYNPLDNINTGFTKSNGFVGRINTGITVNLLKGLRFEGMYGYIKGNNRTTLYDDNTNYQQRINIVNFTVASTPSATPVYYLPTKGGQYTVSNIHQDNWIVRNQLVYDRSWQNTRHQFTALAGQEGQSQKNILNSNMLYGYDLNLQTYSLLDYSTLTTTGVKSPVLPLLSSGSFLNGSTLFNQSEIETRFTSYYINTAYTFNRKYSINAAWRNDQSNLFAQNKSAQRKPVWSVGAKWDLCNEPFFETVKGVNSLSLRATYGITGISPTPGSAASFDVLAPVAAPNAPGGQGLYVATAANPRLTWESTKTFNVGIDYAVLGSRLVGSVDLYQKKTSNLLGNLPVNPLTGYTTIFGNIGDITNKGIELSVSSANITKRDFSWVTILTMSYNKNEINNLVQKVPVITGAQKIAQNYLMGYPAFAVFAYNFAGLDELGDPLVKLSDKTITKGVAAVQADDVLYMGVYQQPWSGGLSNSFRYKALSLNVNIIYNLGHVMFRDANTVYSGYGFINNQDFHSGNLNAEFANRWKQPGDEAKTNVPSFVSSESAATSRRNTNYYVYGNLNVVDASYAKIRDITLSYAMPVFIVKKLHAEQLSFRLQVSNLMLWKANHDNIDPEFQDARFGYRSVRTNQGAITIGAHLTL
ncbi:UNVERIFIED_ORG: TonB-linked SusC/RagA family outer membrane protein [Chitinophaga ginsengisegetis]